MNLPQPFLFSQSSLQDFVDCDRRFQLRYLERRAWPAIESEPALENERFMQQGARFHRLVQQNLLGVVPERLSAGLTEPELERWWQNYIDFAADLTVFTGADRSGVQAYPELALNAPLGRHRLIAQFDLVLVFPPERAVIIDWKTSRNRPRRDWLASRLQTRVYPFLLTLAGGTLNAGQPFQPEQIELIYWFADFPNRPEKFVYNQGQFEADQAYLLSLIERIDTLEPGNFQLTTEESRCRFCVYRSLCDRGERAGDFVEFEGLAEDILSAAEVVLDFEQIAEIEF